MNKNNNNYSMDYLFDRLGTCDNLSSREKRLFVKHFEVERDCKISASGMYKLVTSLCKYKDNYFILEWEEGRYNRANKYPYQPKKVFPYRIVVTTHYEFKSSDNKIYKSASLFRITEANKFEDFPS